MGVRIATAAGSYEATIDTKVGPFAIHRSWGLAGWTVTHVATGRAMAQCLKHKGTAVALAEALQRLPGCDWQFKSAGEAWAWPMSRRNRVRGLVRAFKRDDELGRFATPTPEGER